MAKITVTMPIWEYERLKRLEAKEPEIKAATDSTSAYSDLLQERAELLVLLDKAQLDAEKWRTMPKEAQLLPGINRADAELGALVRKMRPGVILWACNESIGGPVKWFCKSLSQVPDGKCWPTPEEALWTTFTEKE